MGLLRRRDTDGDASHEEHAERAGASPGLVRTLFTLAGVAAAGFLLWLASVIELDESGDFWIAMAVLAGAGLALGLSQLFGGWTKWGWPTLSPTVFLLGFVPTLVVGGWILLTLQPDGGWQQSRFSGWTDDLGLAGFVGDFAPVLAAIPVIVGLVLAFSFDTTGPRTHIVSRDRGIPDEDVHDYRTEGTSTGARTTSDTTVAEDLRSRDDDVGSTRSDERTAVRRSDTT
jgi:hypothetical protein